MHYIETFHCGKKTAVDLQYLRTEYEKGRLMNAHVFAELFAIKPDSKFKQPKNGAFPYSFRDWEVTLLEWNLLMKFIRLGRLCGCDNTPGSVCQLYELGNKLGGIPNLDIYVEKYFSDYSLTPNADTHDKYQWTCT